MVIEYIPFSDIVSTALLNCEPIRYYILPPNQPHLCEKYGYAREAKYKLDNSYYCDDKAASHFGEVANKCLQEGFALIEDFMHHEE